MKTKSKLYVIGTVIAWLILISISAAWNVDQARKRQYEIDLDTGRALFEIIVTTREWNARHGGVYVPITNDVQPNPYLDVPNRDVTTTDGQKLTLINPAYMTRLIAEIADEKDNVKFHITSLKPIRPANAPAEWEAAALQSFEAQGQKEYVQYEDDGRVSFFRYMAPLVTQESCLKCHAKQGYKVGDIRGGISISFPVAFVTPWPLILSHLFIAILGAVLIYKYGSELGNTLQVLENLSNLDGLTRIFNRRYFDEYLKREFLYSRRYKTALSLAICDIDNFKAYNDSYGHPAGDECLKEVSRAITSILKRPGDLVARYGGEEFGIILPYTNAEGAMEVGSLIRAKIESLNLLHPGNHASEYVTISVGITTYLGEEVSLGELLSSADKALYLAKSRGKNHVEYLSAARSTERETLEK
jgi:diguanylate cyclase (GGDEF)-like protein